MAPLVPARRTWEERMELMKGPEVTVVVGAAKKIFKVPKNLLCSYSKVFRAGLEGGTLEYVLVDDDPEDFEILLDYMMANGVIAPHRKTITKLNLLREQLKQCLDFARYADKYDMGGASAAMYDAFRKLLPLRAPGAIGSGAAHRAHLEDLVWIKEVFRIAPPGSPFRPLIAKAFLVSRGVPYPLNDFLESDLQIPGFVAEVLAQFETALSAFTWKDPFSGTTNTVGSTTW